MKKYIGEALATFIFIFISVGCAFALGDSKISLIAIPFAFALSFICSSFIFSNICCCHMNPSVSIAMFLDKRLDKNDFIRYLLAQFIGTLSSILIIALIVLQCSGSLSALTSGYVCSIYDSARYTYVALVGAFLLECILTSILVISFLSFNGNNKFSNTWFIFVAIVLFIVSLFGVIFTGAALNPFRSITTALIFGPLSGDFTAIIQLPIFIIAPIIGSLAGLWLYKVFCKNSVKTKKI